MTWEHVVDNNVLDEVDEFVFAIVKDIPLVSGVELQELDCGTKNVWKSVGYVQNEVKGANCLIDGIVTQSSIYNIIGE